ncbi:hypothetical protein ACLKA6_000636 [Drosophila palustris]
MEQLKEMVQARGRLKASLTRLCQFAAHPPAGCDIDVVETMLSRLNAAWIEFERIGDSMCRHDSVEGYVDPAADNEAYKRKYLQTHARLSALRRAHSAENTASAGLKLAEQNAIAHDDAISRLVQQQQDFFARFPLNSATTNTHAAAAAPMRDVELPKLQIKAFGGDYKEWPAFKDLFETTILNKQHLEKTRKFHYLKSFLTNEAASLISHLPITDAAYDTAWERLIERYNRPRHVVNSLLEAFMELPTTKISNVSVLRKVTDGANEIVRGLDAIGQTGRQDKMSPKLDDLFQFLDARCEEFELSQGHATAEAATCNNNNDKSKKSTRNLVATGQGACVKCGSTEHLLFGCSQFHNMSIEQRRSYIKDKLLCFNCLKPGHTSAKCGSAHSCRHCRGRHNTLLHTQVPPLQSSANQTQQIETASEDSQDQKDVRNAHGTFTACRVLLDSGSELSYVSERCIHALGIARSPSRILVSGISSVKAETTRGFSKLHLRSRVSDNTLDATVHILGKITSPLARDRIDASSLEIFDKLPLADPMFNTTSPIDILLGTDYVWAAFTGDKKLDSHGNVIAISSIFGWIITAITITRKAAATTLFSSIDINASLQRFWELEDTNTDLPPDPEDLKVEEHFRDTHTRDAEGRYIVKLPFKRENTIFANTLQGATSRFEAVERRLLRNTDLQSRQQTLPRLELCGALLLSRLVASIRTALKGIRINVHAWCDSTIVLAWLSNTPSKLKTFVANRTAEILSIIPRHDWHHVSTKENPADCASRGMLAADLLTFDLWWTGPQWLHDNGFIPASKHSAQSSLFISDNRVQEEMKTTTMLSVAADNAATSPLDELVNRVSSWTKFVRIVAYVLRFARRKRISGALTFDETSEARTFALRYAKEVFQHDRQLLLNKQPLRNDSKLRTLAPLIDDFGLLRVGGRLSNSELPFCAKHPIILPKSHRITKLILEHEHWTHLHPGVSALFVIVRQRYWILGARNLIRKITHDCLKCFRHRHHTAQQFMADLPAVRVTQAFPFENTGCDYAGPISLKVHKGRHPRKEKGAGRDVEERIHI